MGKESNQSKKKVNLADSLVTDELDKFIREICETHDTENIEKDIIALFEDIIRFFSGREEEFVRLKDMSAEDQKEMYQEIKAIIQMLKSTGEDLDKAEIISLLSKRIINRFSKNNKQNQNKFSSHEEDIRIKELFAKMTLHKLYLERKQQIEKEKPRHSIDDVKQSFTDFISRESKTQDGFTDREILSKLKQQISNKRFIG